MTEVYRPAWVEPEAMERLGYKLISDKDGYLKYKSKWPLAEKSYFPAGTHHKETINLPNGQRVIYFNTTYAPSHSLVFCNIKEDAGTRTSYHGVVDRTTFLLLLENVQ